MLDIIVSGEDGPVRLIQRLPGMARFVKANLPIRANKKSGA